MKLLEKTVKVSYTNPLKDWYDTNYVPVKSKCLASKYEKGMFISISNNKLSYEKNYKAFKDIYITLLLALTGNKTSSRDVRELKGDWHGDRVKLPKREELLRVIANHTPILMGGVHNYRKDDIRSRGYEYTHTHFYVYNTHHYLPTTQKELRDCEDKIERMLARYINTRKRLQGMIRITPVGTGVHQFTDNVSPLKLYDYLNSPVTNPQENNVINYMANNRHLPSIQYPLTIIYSTKRV